MVSNTLEARQRFFNFFTKIFSTTNEHEWDTNKGSVRLLMFFFLMELLFACFVGRSNRKSEKRCADASRLQPRVAERGTSMLLMAHPTGVSDPGYS
jgi:hypothetical protein